WEWSGNIRGTKMATAASKSSRETRLALVENKMKAAARRTGVMLAGAALTFGAVLILLALISYNPSDPSLNTRGGGTVSNWLGSPGAWTADILLSFLGPLAVLLLPLMFLTGLRLLRRAGAGRWG